MDKNVNEGLKEVGKGLITLSNLILVLFLFNNYMQTHESDLFGIALIFCGVWVLYYLGYHLVNKGDKRC